MYQVKLMLLYLNLFFLIFHKNLILIWHVIYKTYQCFLNLFYIKSAYDYLIGHQLMETMNPGVLKRVEKRMKRDYNQEYLFTKPSSMFKGF